MSRRQYLALTLLGLTLPLLAWGWAVELSYLNRYLNPGTWARISLGVTLMGWALAGWVWRHRLGPTALDQFRSLAALFMVLVLILPLLLSATNRWWATSEPIEVEFVAEEGRYNSRFGLPTNGVPTPNQYLTFFYWHDQLYRIASPQALFANHTAGDRLVLPLQRGRWGILWVDVAHINHQ